MQFEFQTLNYVVSARAFGRVNLDIVRDRLGCGSYRPKRFSALSIKFVNPKASVILFSTGNITVMGAQSRFAALYVLARLRSIIDFDIIQTTVLNIVAKFWYGKIIDLDKLYSRHDRFANYDPDLFPSCCYTIPGTNNSANVFKSGKVVIAGNKSVDAIPEQVIWIANKIREGLE